MRHTLQPYAVEAATLCDGGCNPTRHLVRRAQPREMLVPPCAVVVLARVRVDQPPG
jgi:hypothetical protein